MQVAGAAVDLIDVQGSSVMLCLEDGWDFTAQVLLTIRHKILRTVPYAANSNYCQEGSKRWPVQLIAIFEQMY